MGKTYNLKMKLGGGLILILVLLSLFAPFFPIQNPHRSNMTEELQGLSSEHVLGQDEEGRDVLSRLIYGTRVSLLIGFTTVLISMTLGTAIGLVAGFFGGKVDQFFIFVSDIFLAFPSILLIIAIAAFVPPSILNIIFVLSFVGWVSYARIARGQALVIKNIEYVEATQVLGFSRRRTLLRHIFPNAFGPLIINGTLSLAGVIIAESTLSFLGIGVPQGMPSWGSMLDSGVAYLLVAPHLSIFPGLAIMLTVLAFNFFGDGMRDYYDVRGSEL